MRRLKDVLKFSKPKGSGLMISRNCYLSVLAAKASLPTLLEVISPKGEGGSVAGFGVPLAADAKKEDLSAPIARGVYALSSPDRKTVLKLMVLPKEEAGFDPSVFVGSEVARQWDDELRLRIESTWILFQLTFESFDPDTYPALDFLLSVAKRIAEVCDGAVADPVSQVYRLPEQVFSPRPQGAPVVAADHVQVKSREYEGKGHLYTAGLVKFDLPEVEVYGVGRDSLELGTRFLFGLVQTILMGARLEPGASVGAKDKALKVAAGGLDRGMWEGIPCLELIPDGKSSVDEAMAAWVESLTP